MRLAIGQEAPSFDATTWQGAPFRLDDLRGERVWLAFFRYASCPLCNLRVRAMYRQTDALRGAGVQPIAVFQSPSESIREYVLEGDEPPFPILADPGLHLYGLYGVEVKVSGFLAPRNISRFLAAKRDGLGGMNMEGPIGRIPADFLIGADGALVDVFYGDAISDHIPLERVSAFAGI